MITIVADKGDTVALTVEPSLMPGRDASVAHEYFGPLRPAGVYAVVHRPRGVGT